nr:hypothetical protein [Tanacetum cinerariifolium]
LFVNHNTHGEEEDGEAVKIRHLELQIYELPLTSLDKGLYALACEEDVCFLATLVKSFKLIEVNIEHGVTALDSYIRPPRFRAIIEDITDEAGSIAANRTEKVLLLLTWRESSEPTKKPICDSVTPCSLSQHYSATPCKDYVFKSITPRCIPNETKLDEEKHFADVTWIGVSSYELSHDESFGVVDLDLNLNESENEIVEPDVDVHSFGKIMDLPFDNTCVINLVPNDVLEGEDVDVINADGFKNYPGDPCPWVLYVEKEKHTKNWLVKTHKDTYKCLQSKEIKRDTYKFLYEKIFNQVGVNPKIPVKAVQNQLQRELDVQISMSKAFRAKDKAEREIRGDHVLNYSMLRDYFRASRRDLLGLDGSFMMGPFPNQVLTVVGLDSNNGNYPLDHALVDAKSRAKSDYCLTTSVKSLMVKSLKELTGIPCKHVVATCWNMALNDPVAQPIEAWVGRPRKKRKRSKHKDEPFVKYGKLRKKERTITCQSCGNTRHNKATCKGQGGNNAEATGLHATAGQGGVGGRSAGVASQGSSHIRWKKEEYKQKELVQQKNSHSTCKSTYYGFSSATSETRNADGREMGDAIPTQLSAVGGASQWSFL